ncbi:MAG: hypothetical protein ACREO7_13215 [Pseudoxanthomonas sp.]
MKYGKLKPGSVADAWNVSCDDTLDHLCAASNAFARAAYQRAFDDICAEQFLLSQLDLCSVLVEGNNCPILKSGSNKYYEISSNPVVFDDARFVATGLIPDCYIVIPEAARLASPLLEREWNASCAIDSIRPALARQQLDWVHIEDVHGIAVASALRAFDSHPSISFYWRLCKSLLIAHGWSVGIDGLDVAFRRYKCDLAARFSEVETSSLFVSSKYFRSESPGDTQRGKFRIFENEGAPNQATLLLVGDSHSYSAISQILSHYFKRVLFYWADRASNYGARHDEIAQHAQEADFFIEECSERFFLRNFSALAGA